MVRGDAVAGSVTQQERDAKVRQLVVDLGDGLHSTIDSKAQMRAESVCGRESGTFSRLGGERS